MSELVDYLKKLLGTSFSLYVSTQAAHWNIEGSNFYSLHALFQEQYEDIQESIDRLAEHIRALDTYAPHSMTRFLELSVIPEIAPAPLHSDEYLLFLIEANEQMVNLLTETSEIADKYNHRGLTNFLEERIERHNTHRWKLRASLKK